ncbi:MAG: hypothetical protein PW843_18750 [Azospirillaceae bacterium]|nr:hypothetical protein [Azospirillaceae bacterium]
MGDKKSVPESMAPAEALARADHEKIKKCVDQANSDEKRFLETVNSMPELSFRVLGVEPSKDHDGNYIMWGDVLRGALGRIDPGLKRLARNHFNGVRKSCESER